MGNILSDGVLSDDVNMQSAPPDLDADEAYFAFCAANPDLNFERRSSGEIVRVPGFGGETAFRITEASVKSISLKLRVI